MGQASAKLCECRPLLGREVAEIADLTFDEVAEGARALEAALADPRLMAKGNWPAEVASRVLVAAAVLSQ